MDEFLGLASNNRLLLGASSGSAQCRENTTSYWSVILLILNASEADGALGLVDNDNDSVFSQCFPLFIKQRYRDHVTLPFAQTVSLSSTNL